MKRKSDRDLNILIQEEYFENVAKKSAHYNLSKKYNAEQHSMQQKRNTNISVSNNQINNNDYLNGILIYCKTFICYRCLITIDNFVFY